MFDPVSAGVAIGGSLLSGVLGANSARKQAKARRQAAEAQLALSKEQYGRNMDMLSPYLQGGQRGLSAFETSLGLNGEDALAGAWRNSPDYRLAMEESGRAVDAAAANGGGYFSGARLKGATDAAMRTSAGLLGNYREGLGRLVGIGQQATGQAIGASGTYQNNSNQAYDAWANAKAGGIAGRYDALTSGLQGAAGAFNYYNQGMSPLTAANTATLSQAPFRMQYPSFGG